MWTGNDWYDSVHGIGVKNGVPYSNEEDKNRFLKAPLSFDGDGFLDDYLSMKNVQLVNDIFPEEYWDIAFPLADEVYTHENFLKAVAKFPAFCNETNLSDMSLEESCRKELSTMFAHWGQETGKRDPSEGDFWTQGLYYVDEI